MNLNRWRRGGARLLIAGGLLEASALTAGSVISPPETTLLGASLLLAYAVGAVGTGIGLIATGISLAGRGRTALVVAGACALLVPVVSAVASATGAPLGPAPSLAAYLLYVIALVVAAARVLLNTKLHGVARWAIAVPAACFVLTIVAFYTPRLSPPGIIVLPWAGTAAAGVLLLRPWRQGESVAPHPVQS